MTELKPCEGAQIMAWVGSSEAILAGEVMPGVDELITANKGRIPADELEVQRVKLIKQRLRQLIETRLIYLDAKQKIPAENFRQVEQKLEKQFENAELSKMMQRAKVENRQNLEQKLEAAGTSLEREKRAFVQRTVAQQWARQQVKPDDEITHIQMLDYYREHQADFEKPARARWEELMVRVSKYRSKEEARAAIAQMGNQVLGGVPLAQVAKARSDGSTAEQGGLRDWTTKGSLASAALDEALFALPVGPFSPILESENGYHIIRVIERQEARRTPFLEAQADIEPKIRENRTNEQLRAYLTRLEQHTPVWTIFDGKDEKETARSGQAPNRR